MISRRLLCGGGDDAGGEAKTIMKMFLAVIKAVVMKGCLFLAVMVVECRKGHGQR